MWLEKNDTTGGIFEDDSHADTCLLGKGRKTILVHEYYANVSIFSEDIYQL